MPIRTVRRYKNRKMYDLIAADYISLKQLVALIREGYDILVLENKTGKDMTSYVLAQALGAEEKAESRPGIVVGLHTLLRLEIPRPEMKETSPIEASAEDKG